MLLAIDCGNTNIVFAVFDGANLRGQWRAATKSERTADEYGIWLAQLMRRGGVAVSAITSAIVSSVVPAKNFDLERLCRQYFDAVPRFIGDPALRLGADIKVDNPREVGADRIVNVIAAHASHPGALIVVDFGTATTFDVVDSAGAYRGGCIAPGINLSMEALHMATALLPRLPAQYPGAMPVVGTSTVAQMNSGVYWGYIGLIEGLVTRIKAERGESMTVIATGGLAPLFAESTRAIDVVDANLTLRGLQIVHAMNA
jgi:type III pantothenate kinase